MKQEDFAYIVETKKSFEEAVISVLKAVEKKGWSLFSVYDVKERLAAKGFEHEKLKIIEICSGKYASNFLNKNKLISLCMPGGKIKIVGMKPTMISHFFPEVSKEEALAVEKDIKEIVDSSK